MSDVVRLVPIAERDKPEKVESHSDTMLEALKLAIETIEGYVASKEREPRHLVIGFASLTPDGGTVTEYISANGSFLTQVGLLETVKFDILAKGD